MRILFLAASLVLTTAAAAPARTDAGILEAVNGFYAAFNSHDFSRVDEVTTPDWNHINALGERTVGRAAVLAQVNKAHTTFLKAVTDTPLSTDVELIAPSVALVTVRSRTTDFTSPDGRQHINEQQIRTFVVVKIGHRWLITRDHNTFVQLPAPER